MLLRGNLPPPVIFMREEHKKGSSSSAAVGAGSGCRLCECQQILLCHSQFGVLDLGAVSFFLCVFYQSYDVHQYTSLSLLPWTTLAATTF